ncbi:MAG: exonuclease SbcCD subunit D [Treponema sp.]|nr:exonuclease SbcCD subunit D [Treponema sp.]
MIKFLHTADLHLGKVFHEQSLAEDQAAMLDQLACLLEDDSYAALIIAGDVYDRSIPSPEAADLFGGFLGTVKNKRPSLEILIIPGNHDSALRLGFGREIFARLGVRFGTRAEECDKPIIVEKNGEKCAFFLLPFLNPGALDVDVSEDGDSPLPGGSLRAQAALAREAARRMEAAQGELAAQGVSRSVLAAHLFASGGAEAGSERVFVGAAELVSLSLFNGFDYIALGHLHRCQRIGENAWYSGSPLAYSFGETVLQEDRGGRKQQEKFFLSVELRSGGAEVEKIPVRPLRSARSFSGPFARFAGDISLDGDLLAAKDDYLEIRLTDRGITENARDLLRRRFPRLLSLRQDEALAGLSAAFASGSRGERISGERRNVSADFRDFLTSLYGEGDPENFAAEIELFDALLAEAEKASL